jgi:Helix-turn-helix domain
MDHTQSAPVGQLLPTKKPGETLEAPARVVPWLEWLASHPDLSARARTVFLVLANLDGLRDGKAHPSLRYLQRLLCCSESSVRAAIRELEAEGLLTRHADYGAGEWEGGRQKSNLYRLTDRPRRTESAARTTSTTSTRGTTSTTSTIRAIGTDSTDSTGSTTSTEHADGALGTAGADGADGTGPLLPTEAPPCSPPHPSEDPKPEKQESSDAAVELPPQWVELREAYGHVRCQAVLQLVRTVKPAPAVLAEGVGRLLQRRPNNPAAYLAVVLRSLAECEALPTPEVVDDPGRVLLRRVRAIEARQVQARHRGDLDAQRVLQAEWEEALRELRIYRARAKGRAA